MEKNNLSEMTNEFAIDLPGFSNFLTGIRNHVTSRHIKSRITRINKLLNKSDMRNDDFSDLTSDTN